MTIFCQKRIYDDLTGAQSGGLANYKLQPERRMLHQPVW